MAWYSEATGGGDTTIKQFFPPEVTKLTNTSVSVKFNLANMPQDPSSFKVTYRRLVSGSPVGTLQTATSSSSTLTLTGLTTNSTYEINTQAIKPTSQGNVITVQYYLNSLTETPSATGGKSTGQTAAKSYLKLSSGSKADKLYTFAHKTFDAVVPGSYTTDTVFAGFAPISIKNYSTAYYSFGTSILMNPASVNPVQGAGMGFFIDSPLGSGYFISVQTTTSAATTSTKAVRIFKLTGKSIKQLADSQKTPNATLDSVFAGRVYNIDVKVKVDRYTVTITAYINGFKITATDISSAGAGNVVIDPTNRVALLAESGTSAFDYIYASTITAAQYKASFSGLNYYQGQFSNDLVSLSNGEILYDAQNESDDIIKRPGSFDEFGTVAREIARRTVKFTSGPSEPIHWTTGANALVRILGESKSHFGADVFVLNNSSMTVPLSDNGVNQLSVFGNTIGFSGELEYSTKPTSENSYNEPVIIESAWLQNEKDVAKLASWIKSKTSNKTNIIELKTFGNPMLSVGDVVTIKYEYQGLLGTEKFIIMSISHTYAQGLETNITCRTL